MLPPALAARRPTHHQIPDQARHYCHRRFANGGTTVVYVQPGTRPFPMTVGRRRFARQPSCVGTWRSDATALAHSSTVRRGQAVKALTSILWDRTIRLSRRAETPPAGLTGLSHFPTVVVERNLGQVTRLRAHNLLRWQRLAHQVWQWQLHKQPEHHHHDSSAEKTGNKKHQRKGLGWNHANAEPPASPRR